MPTEAKPFLGLRTTIYTVPDLSLAKVWYSELFDLAPYFDQPFYVGFNVGGFELGLIPSEGDFKPGPGGAVAYWGVADAQVAHARVLSLGAKAVAPLQDVGGGIRTAVVSDPFGNFLGLIENPGSPNPT